MDRPEDKTGALFVWAIQRPVDMAKGHFVPSEPLIPSGLEMFSIRTASLIIPPFIISWACPEAAPNIRAADKVMIFRSISFYLL
jgi:hypothetical protein